MTERPHWQDVGDRLARITEELGDPFNIRDIQITFLTPDWVHGDGVFKGECQTCGANSTMTAHDHSQLVYLAHVVERYECPKQGHRQLESALSYMCANGWANESSGDLQSPMGYFSRVTNEPAEIEEIAQMITQPQVMDFDELIGHFMVQRYRGGEVIATRYSRQRDLLAAYRLLQREFKQWQTDNPTLFEADHEAQE